MIRCIRTLARQRFAGFRANHGINKANHVWTINRTMYTADELTITHFIKERDQIRINFQPDTAANYKYNLRKNLLNDKFEPQKLAAEIKTIAFMMDDTPEDFELLIDSVDRLKTIRDLSTVYRFSIGLILMKTCYHFKKINLAIQFYSDPILKQLCRQKQTCLIFFDLLYKNQRYAELIGHFEDLKKEMEARQKLVERSIYVMAFATCYKQNTAESFKYASDIIKRDSSVYVTQEHLIFYAGLALKQHAVNVVYETLNKLSRNCHVAIPNLQLLAHLAMNEIDAAIKVLRSILIIYDGNKTPKNDYFSREVIEGAEEIIRKIGNADNLAEFKNVKRNLTVNGYINGLSLEEMIFVPFKTTSKTPHQQKKIFLEASFKQLGP